MNDTTSHAMLVTGTQPDDRVVLHVAWDEEESTFKAWGESVVSWQEAMQPGSSPVKRGRPRKQGTNKKVMSTSNTRMHPFAVPASRLGEILARITGNHAKESLVEHTFSFILPVASELPVASTDMQDLVNPCHEIDGEPGVMEHRAWLVPCITVPSTLLAGGLLAPGDTLDDVVLGTTCSCWKEVMKVVLDLLMRHQYLPSRGAAGACWIPVLQPWHHEQLEILGKVMPEACFPRRVAGLRRQETTRSIIENIVRSCVDHFIRAAVADMSGALIMPGMKNKDKSDPPGLSGWLRELVSAAPALSSSPRADQSLAARLDGWIHHAPVHTGLTPFRTCFKLEPPGDDARAGELWHLGYYLQATEDPSLLVPATTAWKHRSKILRFLKYEFENPQERLLEDLGRATRLFPVIESSLNRACPDGLMMSGDQVVEFVQDIAPILDQSGFGVIVPSWWGGIHDNVKISVTMRAKVTDSSVCGQLGLDSLMAYDWKVAIGEDKISPDEFEKLASLKQPLLRWRGKWMMFKPGDTKKLLGFIERQRENANEIQDMTLNVALQAIATGNVPGLDLPVDSVACEGKLKTLVEQFTNHGRIKPVIVPATFHGTLRPYQELGLSWLAFLRSIGFGACLADDMGLGKTIEVISFLLHDKTCRMNGTDPGGSAGRHGRGRTKASKGGGPRHASLLICPVSILDNWKREINRFAPSFNVFTHHGKDRLDKGNVGAILKTHDVVMTTYALAARDKEIFEGVVWNTIIIDEAQNIKNHLAKQAQAIKGFRGKWRVALTGTPVENRVAELWSIMDFLNPSYLGGFTSFHKRFSIPIERYRDPESTNQLKRFVQPFILRRLKTDKTIIKDLPDKVETKEYCHLTREQATLYEAIVNDMLDKIDEETGIKRKGIILSSIMKLKQVCNHPAQFLHDGSSIGSRSGKLNRLEYLVDEIMSINEKVIIFTQFREMGAMIHDFIKDRFKVSVLFLHGGTTKKQRDAMVQQFQTHARYPVFILSLKAGGVGLNLTAANHVIHFDRWWNPAVENQATDRAFRIGQSKNVLVRKFVCTGTMEEHVDEMITRKQDLANDVIQAGEAWVTELSTRQIKDLLVLDQDAVLGSHGNDEEV